MNQWPLIQVYTQADRAQAWLAHYCQQAPLFACVLGFTATGLIPGISAAGASPHDRCYTAIADAEYLYAGHSRHPIYALPPLTEGASPVFISRAVIEGCGLPLQLFNAGLPIAPAVPAIDLGGQPAHCLSHGQAMPLSMVEHLFAAGLTWGSQLACQAQYLVIGECVVGGTTTALAILTGLGIAAHGRVNSSHPTCNHDQKWQLVQAGLAMTDDWRSSPFALVAAVGDPMQIVVAGMTIAASRQRGVLLAGGTQMLAVYALAQAIAEADGLAWNPDAIVVGTTRWVADDPTGDTVGLAKMIGPVPLLATGLSFADSQSDLLRVYERGFVKEGVGAGGCAIAAHLWQGWQQTDLLPAIETLIQRHQALAA